MFNFNTLSDAIPSNFFISTKNHVIFLLNNSSAKLSEVIMFYIIFLSLCSFYFLIKKVDEEAEYEGIRVELNLDLMFVITIILLLTPCLGYIFKILQLFF